MTTIPNGVGKTVITGPLPVDDSPPLATELVVDVSVDPSVDTAGIDIDGAIEAYRKVHEVFDEAMRNPSRDWELRIREYAVDPAAKLLADDVLSSVETNTYVVGHMRVDALIIEASQTDILMRVCLDNSGSDLRQVGREGSVQVGVASPFLLSAMVTKTSDNKWYLAEAGKKLADTC